MVVNWQDLATNELIISALRDFEYIKFYSFDRMLYGEGKWEGKVITTGPHPNLGGVLNELLAFVETEKEKQRRKQQGLRRFRRAEYLMEG